MAGEEATKDKAAEAPAEGQPEATPEERSSPSVDEIVTEAQAAVTPAEGDPSGEGGAASAPAAPASDESGIPAASPEAVSGFLKTLEEQGIDHTFKSEEDAAKAFKELRTKLSERDSLAQIGQQVLPHMDKVNQVLQEATRPVEPESPWNPPHELTPALIAELQKPADQQDPVALQKLQELGGYVSDKWQNWYYNPQDFVRQLVMPMVEERFNAAQAAQNQQQQINGVIESNKEVVTKYEGQIRSLINQGTPLESAIVMMRQYDEIEQLKSGKTPETKVPAGNSRPSPIAGIVEQTPQGQPQESQEDIERYSDPRQAGLDALKASGIDPNGPVGI